MSSAEDTVATHMSGSDGAINLLGGGGVPPLTS